MARPRVNFSEDGKSYWCPLCQQYKVLTEFYRKRGEVIGGYCKPCRKIRAAANKEHKARLNRIALLWNRYSMTEEDYNDMLAAQRGLCMICQRKSSGRFHVDHDHQTKTVRGLLCHKCNMGLGIFNDNPLVLEAAAIYLRNWEDKI